MVDFLPIGMTLPIASLLHRDQRQRLPALADAALPRFAERMNDIRQVLVAAAKQGDPEAIGGLRILFGDVEGEGMRRRFVVPHLQATGWGRRFENVWIDTAAIEQALLARRTADHADRALQGMAKGPTPRGSGVGWKRAGGVSLIVDTKN